MADPKTVTIEKEVERLLGLKPEDLGPTLTSMLQREAAIAENNATLTRDNQSLRDRLVNADRGKPAEVARLSRENDLLKARVGEIEAERGPRRGTEIRYLRPNEPFSRPAKVVSAGYVERVKKGNLLIPYATIEYGDPEHHCDNPKTHGEPGHTCDLQPHAFQITAAHDPLGAPGTWCYVEEWDRLREAEQQRERELQTQAP